MNKLNNTSKKDEVMQKMYLYYKLRNLLTTFKNSRRYTLSGKKAIHGVRYFSKTLLHPQELVPPSRICFMGFSIILPQSQIKRQTRSPLRGSAYPASSKATNFPNR